MDAFEATLTIYSAATFALLRHGRRALTLPEHELDPEVRSVLNETVVSRLGTAYLNDVSTDLWGNEYRIFVGPWPEDWGPVPFRIYMAPEVNPGDHGDRLTVRHTDEDSHRQGYPASAQHDLYIWSLGENGVSDQPHYDTTHTYVPPARSHYRENATDEYLGGGDDINNWDKDKTFMRFYK